MVRVPKTLEKSCDIYSDIWSNKNELRADQVFLRCNIKFLFDCHNCGHEYLQSPDNKTRGNRCPFCSGYSLCGDINCLLCLPKSCYRYKHLWSSKNYKRPEEVSISNGKKFWFDCRKCSHEYEQTPGNKKKGHDCPYCSNQKLCGNIYCSSCLEKSCYKYKEIWSQKNEFKPLLIAIQANKKYLFNCDKCSHEYHQSPANKKKGHDCPFCSKQKLCGNISCSSCLEESCYKYKEIWSQKNYKSPEQVSISNGKKFWFECHNCRNDYQQKPNDKTRGRGCPYCVNKTEKKVADFLKEIDVKFKKEFRIDSKKRYDFYLPDFNLIIEIDGEQHFRQVRNWKSCEYTIENDIQKMKIAIENDYSILRIYQPDIWEENIDWKKYIKDNLYLRKTPIICYQSSIVGIYDRHLKIYSSVV